MRQRTVDVAADRVAQRIEAGAGRLADIRDLAVLLVARDRLMRASEVVSLTVGAIDATDAGAVKVTFRRIKTRDDERTFTLSPDAAAALCAWLAELTRAGMTEGLLFRAIAWQARLPLAESRARA